MPRAGMASACVPRKTLAPPGPKAAKPGSARRDSSKARKPPAPPLDDAEKGCDDDDTIARQTGRARTTRRLGRVLAQPVFARRQKQGNVPQLSSRYAAERQGVLSSQSPPSDARFRAG